MLSRVVATRTPSISRLSQQRINSDSLLRLFDSFESATLCN